jgi:hypothetical protein
MNIEAISGSATVAITCTIVFFLAAKSWQLVARSIASHPNFPDSIMREAAQRFRDELEQLSRRQSTYFGAGFMFIFVFGVAYTFQANQLFVGYPAWQLYILLGALGCAAGLALYRLVCTVTAWRQIRFLRDANIAVGHSLQRIASGHGRVFHDVVTSAGVVDHVIVGQSGIYAVNVVARRSSRKGSVQLSGNELHFMPRDHTSPIVEIAAKSTRLEHDFRQLLKNSIRVRSVIAVPGWNVESQNGNGHLVVNERTLPMLRGWKDEADYLMNEDVDALHKHLTSCCKRSSGAKKAR